MTLHERIRNARKKSGLSLKEVEEQLNLSRIQVWRIENKSETLSAKRLFELADLFGVDARTLLEGRESPEDAEDTFSRIQQVTAFVEQQAQIAKVVPSPELVAKAVVAVLRQELGPSLDTTERHFQSAKYADLVQLIFEGPQ